MMIHEVTEKVGRHKARKRIGRGPGSGTGKTAGRGHKGQLSRSGYSRKFGSEGGQMPWYRRLPKRGFSNARYRLEYIGINVKALEARFPDGAEVNPEMLVKMGLLDDASRPVKILGDGELAKTLHVAAAAFSKSAEKKIVDAGGDVTRIA